MKGASSPASRATRAISGWSVETTARSMKPQARAMWPARATSGMPPTGCRFFSGMPFEPPRAGTTARMRLSLNIAGPKLRRHPPQVAGG